MAHRDGGTKSRGEQQPDPDRGGDPREKIVAIAAPSIP